MFGSVDANIALTKILIFVDQLEEPLLLGIINCGLNNVVHSLVHEGFGVDCFTYFSVCTGIHGLIQLFLHGLLGAVEHDVVEVGEYSVLLISVNPLNVMSNLEAGITNGRDMGNESLLQGLEVLCVGESIYEFLSPHLYAFVPSKGNGIAALHLEVFQFCAVHIIVFFGQYHYFSPELILEVLKYLFLFGEGNSTGIFWKEILRLELIFIDFRVQSLTQRKFHLQVS